MAVIGAKGAKKDGSEAAEKLALSMLAPESLPGTSEIPGGRYALPETEKDVATFRGAEFNEAELAAQLAKSKSVARLWQRSAAGVEGKRPPLPLSPGQIGLVGGSGLINGLVDCDAPHVIKGMVIKKSRQRVDEIHDAKGRPKGTALTETRANKLVFNLLTPQGFVSLTERGGGKPETGSEAAPPAAPAAAPLRKPGNAGAAEACGLDAPPGTPVPARTRPPKFATGRIVLTDGAKRKVQAREIVCMLSRHETGDWGSVDEATRRSNEKQTKEGGMIFSSYPRADGTSVWAITKPDRSETTVMLSTEEYMDF